jgi:hypothetical protein
MHQGKPCFFLEKSCSIYANRPQDPCRDYSCAWVEEDIFPMWMKPNISNLIITKKIPIEGEHLAYYEATEAGSKMDSSVLNWLIHWAMGNSINLVYQIDGKQHIMGKPDFMQHRKI